MASAGGYHTLALTADNELYGWGNSIHGECGHGEFTETLTPKLVKLPKTESILKY
jgi:alpha-tubulin suppressor-like RCC1 family protein